MDYLTSIGETQAAEPPGQCELCKGAAVTHVPLIALKKEALGRLSELPMRDTTSKVPICASCMLLHCDETYEGDGPRRGYLEGPAGDSNLPDRFARNMLANKDQFEKGSRSKEDEAFDYAAALLRVLERGGYHIYLRSDGRQIIMSHQDGLDKQTRQQVERYGREITEVIIERLWKNEEERR